MAGLILCAYALKQLGMAAPSWLHAGLACAAGVAMLVVFARRQRAALSVDRLHAVPQPRLQLGRGALFAAAALLGMELVFSQRLQLVQGMSPMQAALYILPLSLAAFVAGPLAGWMLPRVGSRRMLISSLLVSGAGMGGYLLSYDAALIPQIASLCVLGAGIGAAMTAASGTIMQSAPVERAGMAASVEEVSYELGGALGVTLMGSILSGVYAQSLDVPVGVAASPARDSLDEALIVADQLSAELGGALAQLARTAFDAGYAAVLASCTAMLLGAAVVVLLKGRARPDGKPARARPRLVPVKPCAAPCGRPSATPSRILAPINARFKAPATSSSACAP